MKHIQTYKEFLNENLSDSAAYSKVVEILKTLHGFSNKIKFRTEDVNRVYNIVYDDPKGLTEDCLSKLRSRDLWNNEYTPSVAKFTDRINLHFDKSVQDILNIKDFDQKSWNVNPFK